MKDYVEWLKQLPGKTVFVGYPAAYDFMFVYWYLIRFAGASRATTEDETSLLAYKGNYAAIMARSPGGLGGVRGLVFLRMLFGNIGITVLPDEQAVPSAFQAFDESGVLKNDKMQAKVKDLGKVLSAELLKK